MNFIFAQTLRKPREERAPSQKQLGRQPGAASGLGLCRTLLEIDRRANIAFLAAYPDDPLDARQNEAGGFAAKALTVEEQLGRLRDPFSMGGADE